MSSEEVGLMNAEDEIALKVKNVKIIEDDHRSTLEKDRMDK